MRITKLLLVCMCCLIAAVQSGAKRRIVRRRLAGWDISIRTPGCSVLSFRRPKKIQSYLRRRHLRGQ